VYVVELDREVLTERAFVKANPKYRPGRLCLYVGSTCLAPEERLGRHLIGRRANRYVYRYGVRLRPDFYHMYPPMSRDEAELTEQELAEELRAEGYGVWYNV
jgi:Uri superfamily endonuclease